MCATTLINLTKIENPNMEKSIALYLVIVLIGYVSDEVDAAEEADLLVQNSWNLDTLSPGM